MRIRRNVLLLADVEITELLGMPETILLWREATYDDVLVWLAEFHPPEAMRPV
jgi:hypothetical protein